MTPSPPAARNTACRPSINPSSIFTPSSSSPSTKRSFVLRTPTNSSCASRESAPPPTPPAKKWKNRWRTSNASPESSLFAPSYLFSCSGRPLGLELQFFSFSCHHPGDKRILASFLVFSKQMQDIEELETINDPR